MTGTKNEWKVSSNKVHLIYYLCCVLRPVSVCPPEETEDGKHNQYWMNRLGFGLIPPKKIEEEEEEEEGEEEEELKKKNMRRGDMQRWARKEERKKRKKKKKEKKKKKKAEKID